MAAIGEGAATGRVEVIAADGAAVGPQRACMILQQKNT